MTAMQGMVESLVADERVKRPAVIERATQVLDAFLAGSERLTLEDVIAVTGFPRSTAFRILNQLVELQWLEHYNPGYRLGERARWMGARRDDLMEVRAAAAGHLSHLQLTTGTVVHLVVREGAQVLYLDKLGGPAADTVPSRIGSRVSVSYTVAGKALLASMPPERVDQLLCLDRSASTEAPRRTLHRDLDRIRQRNYLAFAAAGDCPLGIGAVATVVSGPSGPVAAISAAARGHVSLEALAPLVALAARRISHDLTQGRSGAQRRPRCTPADEGSIAT